MPNRKLLVVASLLVWTLFVWLGRIRNAVTDDTLSGWDRTGPIVLAGTFVVAALVLSLGWVLLARRGSARPSPTLAVGTLAFAGWTAGVWLVRAADIILGGDHEVGFVVVHTVLATVSIGLAVAVGWMLLTSRDRSADPDPERQLSGTAI